MKFNKLIKSTVQMGNPTDTSGALFGECLILGMYPDFHGNYRYIILAPRHKESNGYKHYIGFASKNKEGSEVELCCTKALNFYDGGPATYWGADPNQPQYKMYEGDKLDYFVQQVHEALKKGEDPELKTFRIDKRR
jgi:hypothetical protein